MVGAVGLILMATLGYLTMNHIINCVHLTRSRLRRHAIHGGRSVKDYGSSASPRSPASESEGTDVDGFIDPAPSPSPSLDVAASEKVVGADPDFEAVGYVQVAGVCFGRRGKSLVDLVLIFAQLGCGTAFISLVLTSLQAVAASYGIHVRLLWVACGVFPVVLMLALPRTTTYLASAAHMGNATLLLCVATLVFYGVRSSESHFTLAPAFWRNLPLYSGSHQGVLIFFGICAFSFAAHAEIVAVESDAQSRQSFQGLILPLAIASIAGLYISVGVFAYACFLASTHPNVLLNMGASFYVNLVRVAMSLTLVVNFALAVLPASQALDLVCLGPAPLSTAPHQAESLDLRVEQVRAARAAASGETTPLLAPRPFNPNPFATKTPPAGATDTDNRTGEASPTTAASASSSSSTATDSLWPLDQPDLSPFTASSYGSSNGDGPGNGHAHAHTHSNGAHAVSVAVANPFATIRPPTAEMVRAQEERERAFQWYQVKGNVVRTCMCMLTFSIASEAQPYTNTRTQHIAANSAATFSLIIVAHFRCGIALCVCSSVLVRNLGVLFSIVGSVAGGLLCFTLPPLLWYRLCELEGRPLSALSKASLALQTAFGLALITAGIIVIVESAHETYNITTAHAG